MASVTVVFRGLLRLPVTAKTGGVRICAAFSGNCLEGIRLYSFERLVARNAFQRERYRPALVREMTGGANIRRLHTLILLFGIE